MNICDKFQIEVKKYRVTRNRFNGRTDGQTDHRKT